MKTFLFNLVIFSIGFLFFPASADTEYDFFRNPEMSTATLNPTGSLVLMKKISGNRAEVMVLDVEQKQEFVVATSSLSSGYSIFDLGWLDDNTIAFTKSHFHRGGRVEIYRVDNAASGFSSNKIHSIKNTYIYSHIPKMANQFVAVRYKKKGPQLFKIDLGKVIESQFRSKLRINKKKLGDGSWLVNHDGTSNIYSIVREDEPTKVYYRKDGRRNANVLIEMTADVTLRPQLLDKKNSLLYVITDYQSNYNHIRSVALETGELSEILHIVQGRDIDHLLIDSYKGQALGYSYKQGGVINNIYFEQSTSEDQQSNKYIVSRNRDADVFVYTKGGIDTPFQFYLDNKGEETLLGSTMPWLAQHNLGKSHVVKSTSSDGTVIESFLTMPTNRGDAKVPLIVMPHGGPIGIQDTRHFSATTHYFAHHGFAVLSPNYRGSAGYGKSFLSAGKRQWGRLIEDDVDSALNMSIEAFNIDPGKVCILGISYGGYSALVSSIRFPQKYKCAVSYAGVTDLTLLYSQSQVADEDAKKKIWSELAGDIEADWDLLVENSPVYNVDKIQVPILIAQGGRDRIVDEENYLRMLYMLKRFNKEYEKLYMLNEIHGFRKINSEITFFKQAREFISGWVDKT